MSPFWSFIIIQAAVLLWVGVCTFLMLRWIEKLDDKELPMKENQTEEEAMKKLKFILHENADRLDENGKLLPDKVTTLGFKFELNGVWYGDYMILNKPTATVQDIMVLLEELCPLMEQALEYARLEADNDQREADRITDKRQQE